MKSEETKISLAILKEQMETNTLEHKEIKETLVKIDCKLDKAISEKADKSEVVEAKAEVKDLRDKSWQIIAGIFLAMITALIGLIISLIKK